MDIGLPDLFQGLHWFQKYLLHGRVAGLRVHVLERSVVIFAVLLVELRSVSFLEVVKMEVIPEFDPLVGVGKALGA